MKPYVVIIALELLADSPEDAVARAQDRLTMPEVDYYVQVATKLNLAAVESAIMGAQVFEQ